MLHVGLDAHSDTSEIAAEDEKGRIVYERSFETSAHNLIEHIVGLKGKKVVTFEEGPLAAWLKETLTPYVDELIVSDPKRNRWIGQSENKNDRVDARKLALLLRGGYIRPVYHADEDRRRFKEIVLFYHDITRDIVRLKNKIKAEYRENGVPCKGWNVFDPTRRQQWLAKLAAPGALFQVKNYYALLDELNRVHQRVVVKIARMSTHYWECGAFQELPGVGPIISATISAILATPHRFKDKRHLWAYAGLAVVSRNSGQGVGPEHLNFSFNRLLKWAAKNAAHQAIVQGDNQFASQYKRLLSQGVRESSAKLTVARSILATMYGMWKNQTSYQPRLAS